MESIRKKAGFLEGILSTMNLDDESPSDKLTRGIVSLLSELTERVETMDDLIGELNDYVESIDDDLSDLEGMHDDDDDFLDFEDEEDSQEPLRLIRSDDKAVSFRRTLCMCGDCGRPFYATSDLDQTYACPHCGHSTRPVEIGPDSVPTVKPEKP